MNARFYKGMTAVAIAATMALGGAVPALAVTETKSVAVQYKTSNGTTSPAETVTYDVASPTVTDGTAQTAPVLTVDGVSYAKDSATAAGYTQDVVLHFADTDTPGVYTYTLTPSYSDPGQAGLVTDNDTLTVKYTVYYGTDGNLTTAVAIRKGSSTTKLSADTPIVMQFNTGNLDVSKSVQGNLGDKEKEFDITVTLTRAEGATYGTTYTVTGAGADDDTTIAVGTPATFHLHDGEHVQISDLPDGMTYTVTEGDHTGYESQVSAQNPISKDSPRTVTVTVTNTKNGDIDTGVFLNNAPYLAILGGVGAAAIIVINRRRHANDED